MGLFSKESCIVCGGKVNALTKAKTSEGSVCSSCLSLCSPNFVSNIKNKNVSEIKMHIEYIKENQELYKNFQATDIRLPGNSAIKSLQCASLMLN